MHSGALTSVTLLRPTLKESVRLILFNEYQGYLAFTDFSLQDQDLLTVSDHLQVTSVSFSTAEEVLWAGVGCFHIYLSTR